MPNQILEAIQNQSSNQMANQQYNAMSLINDNGAVFVASKVKELIDDVGAELEEAISFWMPKKALDFSIEVILQEQ